MNYDKLEAIIQNARNTTSVAIPFDCNAVPQVNLGVQKQKGKTAMCYDCEMETTMDTRTADERKAEFLVEELANITSQKRLAIWDVFNMNGTPYPQSPKEMVDYIKDGKFKFTKNFLNDDGSWRDEANRPWRADLLSYLRWEDPAKATDSAGYTKALDALYKAERDLEREIRIGTPAEGLKVLKDFEARTFH